jgi:hypothetical protein
VGLWARFRKRRAIRGYLREAPQALLTRYGYLESYSAPQVLATLVAARLSVKHADYACALFSNEATFVAWALKRPTAPRPTRAAARERYRALRLELAEDYNGGHDFKLEPPRKDFEQWNRAGTSRYGMNSGFTWYR